MGDTNSKSYTPYSTASVDSQGDGVWVSLCAPRVVAAFDRSRYNQSERAKSFLQHNNSVVFAMRSFANEKMKNLEKSEKRYWQMMKNMVYYQSCRKEQQAKSKGWKKLKKVLENPLTNRQQSDIINKLSTERLQRIAHWKLNNNKMY